MKRVTRKGLVTAMVAGGVLASAGYAQADATAGGEAAGSPGVLSGNSVQVPVDVPVNVCGNTVDVVGLLNPAMGNTCANTSVSTPGSHRGAPAVDPGGPRRTAPRHRGAPAATRSAVRTGGDGAQAAGGVRNAPGVLSGNAVQLPVHVPVNLSGNSVNVVGVGNPSFGNTSVNGDTPPPPVHTLPAPPAHQPIPAPPNSPALPQQPEVAPVAQAPTLAHTGAAGVGWTAAGSAGLLLGGTLLYRRVRPGRG
jgi:hypothetical protein